MVRIMKALRPLRADGYAVRDELPRIWAWHRYPGWIEIQPGAPVSCSSKPWRCEAAADALADRLNQILQLLLLGALTR